MIRAFECRKIDEILLPKPTDVTSMYSKHMYGGTEIVHGGSNVHQKITFNPVNRE